MIHLAAPNKDEAENDLPVTQCLYYVTDKWKILDLNWDDEIPDLKRCKSCETWRNYLIKYFDKPTRNSLST